MISLLLRLLLAAVFLYAGFAKLLDPVSLAEDILQYHLVPESLVYLFALALPPFEILTALALLIGPWKRHAAFSLAVLCLLFLGALGWATLRGLSIECRCFGAASATSMTVAMVRDLLLLGLALICYRLAPKTKSGSHQAAAH